MISLSDWQAKHGSIHTPKHRLHVKQTGLSCHAHTHTHTTRWHTNVLHTHPLNVRRKKKGFPSKILLWLPQYSVIIMLLELFPPVVILSSGHCAISAPTGPKWGPFMGIFGCFRMFRSHFSSAAASQTPFRTIHTCGNTHKTHRGVSFPDPNQSTPASSDFLHLTCVSLLSVTGKANIVKETHRFADGIAANEI